MIPQKRKAEPSGKDPAGAPSSYMIDLDNFQKRLKGFYSHWNEHKTDFWGACDVLTIMVPQTADSKSSTFSIWLLGCMVHEVVMFFTEKHIHLLCTEEKASLLKPLKNSAREAVNAEMMIHFMVKGDNGAALMDEILQAAQAQFKSDGHDRPIGGCMMKEAPEGKLFETWAEKLKVNFLLRDIENGLSELFSVKDSIGLMNVKKGASLCSSVMKYFAAPIFKNIAHFQVCPHSSVIDDMEKFIFDQATKNDVAINPKNIDLCYRPIFQSGCGFDLDDLSMSMNDWDLECVKSSVFIAKIGLRYNGYCSNIARTFIYYPHAEQSKALEVLLKAQEVAIAALKPGNKVSAAYQAAISVVQKEAPEFASYLTESAGAGIGLEFCEPQLSLDASNNQVVKAGMVFNVSLGFQNLEADTKNPMTEKFSLLLADTIVINEADTETATAVSLGGEFGGYVYEDILEMSQQDGLITNKNINDVGQSCELMVQINKEMESILVPIRKSMVPFHISTIRRVWYKPDQHFHDLNWIHIDLNIPEALSDPHGTSNMQSQQSSYVKDIVFRTGYPIHLVMEVFQQIKTLHQKFLLREWKRAKHAGRSFEESVAYA